MLMVRLAMIYIYATLQPNPKISSNMSGGHPPQNFIEKPEFLDLARIKEYQNIL